MEEGLSAPADDHSPEAVPTELCACHHPGEVPRRLSWAASSELVGEGNSGRAKERMPPACWLVDLPQNVKSKGERTRVRMWAPGGLALTLESPSELDWKLCGSRGVICSLFDISGA